MGVAEREVHGTGGLDIFDSKGKDDLLVADGGLDFAVDLWGVIGGLREDEQEDLAVGERVVELFHVLGAAEYIARADPAWMRWASSAPQVAAATSLSFEEWQMKT